MNENSLTPKEIRESLDVVDATIRNYVKHFGQFLSPDATRKTRKRFSPTDVQILQIAKSYLEEGYTYDQTANLLETQPLDDIQITKVEKPTQEETTAIQPKEFYEQFKIALAAKDQTIEILLSENERLRAQLGKRPWWRFWG